MMKRLFTILVSVLVAGLAIAAGDSRVTSDSGLSVTGYSSCELLADGDATVTFYDSSDTLIKTYYLRDGIARRINWSLFADGIDSLYVDLDTATETIITLK